MEGFCNCVKVLKGFLLKDVESCCKQKYSPECIRAEAESFLLRKCCKDINKEYFFCTCAGTQCLSQANCETWPAMAPPKKTTTSEPDVLFPAFDDEGNFSIGDIFAPAGDDDDFSDDNDGHKWVHGDDYKGHQTMILGGDDDNHNGGSTSTISWFVIILSKIV